MGYRRAVILTLSMAEICHRRGYYELAAVCARKLAEMYVAGIVKQEYWSLHEGLDLLPYETSSILWKALKECQRIGNEGAHAREERMSQQSGDAALSVACIVAQACVAHQPHSRH